MTWGFASKELLRYLFQEYSSKSMGRAGVQGRKREGRSVRTYPAVLVMGQSPPTQLWVGRFSLAGSLYHKCKWLCLRDGDFE
jgi:hypothetical protein